MTNYKEILRLKSLGINNTQIAYSCNCSRTTVINSLKRAEECNLTWEKVSGMSNEELTTKFITSNPISASYQAPDYDYIHTEMAKSGVTLSLLWLEYCEQCRESGLIPYKHTQFYKYYQDFVHKTKATMHLEHKPGEIMEVDWAGQKLQIIDTDTGKPVKVSIFVSVLPYSSYVYVEGFLSQNQENWTTAHVNAYNYFGGVTRILVPDNLKTGVITNTSDDLVINKTYLELAEHYGTAIIPARPRSPKDKATVEKSVNIVSTWILGALRNQQFLSLRECNATIFEKLVEFNNKEFQMKDGCRASLFEREKIYLLPLPEKPYEPAIWKIATVQYNYHITVENKNYSCPYEYIKKKVDVRISRNIVEIFFSGTRIASHPRLHGHFPQYSTVQEHMPPNHQMYVRWDGERFRKWAGSIGPNTYTVVTAFLTSHKVEQQGYKSCMALLKLADKYSIKCIDEACKHALSFTKTPSLKSIQAIIRSGRDKSLIDEPESEPTELSSQYAFTRGPEYYRKGDD
jgi:transposase